MVVEVCCGANHSLIRSNDGRIYGFGSNARRHLFTPAAYASGGGLAPIVSPERYECSVPMALNDL